ncbi:MAG TPA: hypothetical protein DCQ63_03225 [Planktothrix sp. UBA8402]|nr:hypothetical protein [Planktothrix sp. UBA8402]
MVFFLKVNKTGNGEWAMGNGIKTGNRPQKIPRARGAWGGGNGQWLRSNDTQRMGNLRNSLLPIAYSLLPIPCYISGFHTPPITTVLGGVLVAIAVFFDNWEFCCV